MNDGTVTILQESSVQDGRGPPLRSPKKKPQRRENFTKKISRAFLTFNIRLALGLNISSRGRSSHMLWRFSDPVPIFFGMKRFPIITSIEERKHGAPTWVPWAAIAPHEDQAQENHMQSLERLAERGGLDAGEFIAVMQDKRYEAGRQDEGNSLILELRTLAIDPD